MAMEAEAQQALRAKVSDKLIRFFQKVGLLLDTPTV